MKKMISTLVFSLCAFASLSAMSYEEAREQARFLTDKMAYELNLNDQQYNDCYEINLDYLLSVQTEADLYGDYLTYRNSDLRHILCDWQYTLFAAADYFFRPLTWYRGSWLFPIYRYYRLGHYYYNHPAVYYHYRGGHGRHYYRGGYYYDRRPHWDGGFRGPHRGAISHRGPGGHSFHHPGGSHVGRPDHRSSGSGHIGRSDHRPSGTYQMGVGGRLSGSRGSDRPNMDTRAQGHSSYNRPSSTRTTVGSSSHRPSGMGSHASSAPSRGSFSGASSHGDGSFHSGGRSSMGGSGHSGSHSSMGGSHRGGGRGR